MKWRSFIVFLGVGLLLSYFPELKDTLGYKTSLLGYLYFIFYWGALATSWNILTGYSGYFSFGHGAFYGVGVYTSATIFTKLGVPFLWTIPLAGIMSALLGLLVGLVVFRLRKLQGELFALLTLAVDFVVASAIRNIDFIDGGYGVNVRNISYPNFLGTFPEMRFRMGLLILMLTIFAAYTIYHSRLGRGLFAIRDDEAVAEGLGVPTFRFKMIAFGVSAFFAGLAGGFHTVQIAYVEVEGVFRITIPLFVILMSLLGGRRHWIGPLIGAAIIHTFNDAFSSTGTAFTISGIDISIPLLNDIFLGALLIVIVLFVPEGLYDRLRLRLLPSIALATGVTVIQALMASQRLTVQFAVTMLFVVALLLIPETYYQRLIGRYLPSSDRIKAKVSAGE